MASPPASVLSRGSTRAAREEHGMAEYLILIYQNEAAWESAPPETFDETIKGHGAFMEQNSSAIKGGNALQPTATATSVRRDAAGGFTVTDGPFAETKEALGGYYLVEASDLDQALELARQVPAAFGGVEVRPVRVFN
jgi:hypothetical protein